MSKVPHCPQCGRADKVIVRAGPGYQWFCSHPACLQSVIEQKDVKDIEFMQYSRAFTDLEIQIRTEQEYSDECRCQRCRQ